MSEPILPKRQWPAGIQQASVPANDNALRDEAMERPCLGVANDASGTDADGDVWLVGDTPAGAFASFDENDIALRYSGAWSAWAPVDGLRLVVDDVRKVYVGGSTNEWQDDPSVAGGSGSGDVVGPASSTAGNLALFDGTTGKLLKDGGAPASRTPNVQSVTSAGTVTPTFSNDMVKITAQAAGLTLANPTGTAIPGLGMVIRIKDNGTARSIGYGTQYRAIGVTLPTTTVIGKTLYLAMIFNDTDTTWDVIAVGQQA